MMHVITLHTNFPLINGMNMQSVHMSMVWSHLEVGHEVSEDSRAFLLQQALQADDERNCVLYEGLLLDLWIKVGR